jgi:integrase
MDHAHGHPGGPRRWVNRLSIRSQKLRRARAGRAQSPATVRASGATGAALDRCQGLHFHGLRHTGNTFAAAGGAGIKNLMACMGHDSERAALIYQHQARGADKIITGNIDAHVEAERGRKWGADGDRSEY